MGGADNLAPAHLRHALHVHTHGPHITPATSNKVTMTNSSEAG